MTPEFDEEVVFENSPLYQYLQDLGQTDFEICSSVSPKAEQCTSEEGLKENSTKMPSNGILLNLAESFTKWTSLFQCCKNDDLLHKLDVGFRLDSLRTILQQEVLLQEDVELIELLDPSILSMGQPQQQEDGYLPTLRSLATPNIWDVSMLLGYVSFFIMIPAWWNISSWPLWGLILIVYLVIRASGWWRTARLQMTLRKYNVQLEDTVANSRAFTNLVRKSLRLIQETEVISRGFTLLLDRVSAACPFNKAGQHPSQHLIGLRKAVYRTVRTNFRAARLATLYMLKNYPLNSESDNVTNYICVIPFKELGLGLSEEQVSEEEEHNLTDGFSLPALKVLFQLWVGQSSEFFRRLALLLSTVNAPRGPFLTPALSSHRVLYDVTQGLPHAHAACLEELKRSYEFYRYFETQHRSEAQRLSKTKQKSKELNSLHTAVRSLQLHLKALLNEVIILEDELEKLVGTKEANMLASEAYQILEQKLKLLQPRVEASNSCWKEALSQVDKLVRRNSDKKAVMKPLSPVEPMEPINNSESPVNSNKEKDSHKSESDPEEGNSELNPTPNDSEISRTEYLCDGPSDCQNQDSTVKEGFSAEAEEKTCYQCESEGGSEHIGEAGMETLQPALSDSIQASIRERLARLHPAPDFSITSGLATQAAARSLMFTKMEEQTFEDSETEEENEGEQQTRGGNENKVEESKNKETDVEDKGV
ncbi:vezatin isoform X3 [Petaurus breviceps papuanus]|uniref:vezatin isoform X3 n=1 Tax=Petaurus breviceps papuanus TaxID=3040969 RepID=UPI0036DEA651